jgi:hypothetical protein
MLGAIIGSIVDPAAGRSAAGGGTSAVYGGRIDERVDERGGAMPAPGRRGDALDSRPCGRGLDRQRP